MAKTTFADGTTANGSTMHDVGAANMLLTMQANSMGISTNLTGGFDRKKITDLLPLEADAVPVAMVA